MLDQNVLHSVETKIEGMGDARIWIGEAAWDAPGLMIEIQWKDANNNWVHGRVAPEFPMAALSSIQDAIVDFLRALEESVRSSRGNHSL